MARKSSSLVDTAYGRIRDKIVAYQLAPGAPVSDHQLAAEFGMSRAPVREAILRLEGDGLIEVGEDGKSRVSGIGYADVVDIMHVRRALENEAIRTIAENGWLTEEQLAELKTLMEAYSGEAQTEAMLENNRTDDDFHKTIVRFSGNARMLNIIERLNTQMLRARWVNVAVPERQREVPAEHQAIFSALERRDLDAALKANEQHLANSQKPFGQVYQDPQLRQVMAGMASFLHPTE